MYSLHNEIIRYISLMLDKRSIGRFAVISKRINKAIPKSHINRFLVAETLIANGDLETIQFNDISDKCEYEYLFKLACSTGHIHIAKWIHKMFDISTDCITKYKILDDICDIRIGKWLIKTFNIDKHKVRCFGLLRKAYRNYDIEFLSWICKEFSLNAEIVVKSIILVAKDNERLDIFKWICDTFSISIGHICAMATTPYINDLQFAKNIHATYNLTKREVIDSCCIFSTLEFAKWAYSTFNITKNDINAIHMTFMNACKHGDLDIVLWMYETFSITRDDIPVLNLLNLDADVYTYDFLFAEVCVWGNLPVVKWLYETFPISYNDFSRDSIEYLKYMSQNGKLDTIKWVVDTFNFTREDVLQEDCATFRIACKHNHVAKWLLHTFKITPQEIIQSKAFAWSGSLETAKWVYQMATLADTTLADTNLADALYNACIGGNIQFMKWLCDTFTVTKNMIRKPIISACEYFHHDMVVWLCKKFNISKENILEWKVFIFACIHNNISIVRWLANTYELTRSDIGEIYPVRADNKLAHNDDVNIWLKDKFGF